MFRFRRRTHTPVDNRSCGTWVQFHSDYCCDRATGRPRDRCGTGYRYSHCARSSTSISPRT